MQWQKPPPNSVWVVADAVGSKDRQRSQCHRRKMAIQETGKTTPIRDGDDDATDATDGGE